MATEKGAPPVLKSLLAPKVPSPFPSITDTLLELNAGTTRSEIPSAFRSAITTSAAPRAASDERKGDEKMGAADPSPKVKKIMLGRNAMSAHRSAADMNDAVFGRLRLDSAGDISAISWG